MNHPPGEVGWLFGGCVLGGSYSSCFSPKNGLLANDWSTGCTHCFFALLGFCLPFPFLPFPFSSSSSVVFFFFFGFAAPSSTVEIARLRLFDGGGDSPRLRALRGLEVEDRVAGMVYVGFELGMGMGMGGGQVDEGKGKERLGTEGDVALAKNRISPWP